MAVFTALRNKAQSGLAGLVTGAASSALGLNRATGLRFPDSGGNRPSGRHWTPVSISFRPWFHRQ